VLRTEGRDHRRDVRRDDIDLATDLCVCPPNAVPPRLVDVVFE
jgi:hypothetical protein